jgi:hypothetical protein
LAERGCLVTDRRGFLASLLALVAAPFLPKRAAGGAWEIMDFSTLHYRNGYTPAVLGQPLAPDVTLDCADWTFSLDERGYTVARVAIDFRWRASVRLEDAADRMCEEALSYAERRKPEVRSMLRKRRSWSVALHGRRGRVEIEWREMPESFERAEA